MGGCGGLWGGDARQRRSFVSGGFFASWGLRFATLALLALIFGQRMAKDYGGAAVVAAYMAVALLGNLAFAIGK